MTGLRILQKMLRSTSVTRIFLVFLAFLVVSTFIVWKCEPTIISYRDAVWYVYAVVTTIGFGDYLATVPVVRIISIFLSIYTHFALALITGLAVSFFNEVMSIRNKETITAFIDKLEHLPELSKEELTQLSEQVTDFRLKHK